MSNLIEQQWQGFLKAVIPKEASDNQILSMRQAFFGGALVTFNAVVDIGEMTEEDALRAMGHLDDAMQKFRAESQAMAEKVDNAAH